MKIPILSDIWGAVKFLNNLDDMTIGRLEMIIDRMDVLREERARGNWYRDLLSADRTSFMKWEDLWYYDEHDYNRRIDEAEVELEERFRRK